jgi:hypothetical protein
MFAAKDTLFTRPSGGAYQISRSVRLRASATAYLNRTPASATNRQIWTWSAWTKLGSKIGAADACMFNGGATSNDRTAVAFASNDRLHVYNATGGSINAQLISTAKYRDPSAWYHIVAAIDTTQATSSNRIKIYVNGVQVTAFDVATYPAQNLNTSVNNNVSHTINTNPSNEYWDGYLTEINFIDGQQLTPSSFGETNAVTGVWQPKEYAGTYGTNGFYLNFSDNASTTTLGDDLSGNGNDWTTNNISVTAGATYDSMIDVPTLYDDSGNGRGNYPAFNAVNSNATLSRANLQSLSPTASWVDGITTMSFPVGTGKWYVEATNSSNSNECIFGVTNTTITAGNSDNYRCGYSSAGLVVRNGYSQGDTTGLASYTTNDVIGMAVDCAAGTVAFYKNNTLINTTTAADFIVKELIAFTRQNNAGFNINFGQRPFTYTPPTGFVALNTQNLPAPTISNGASYMAATTYTGTGSALTVANTVGSASFQPDLVWVKGRSGATDHALYDAVRGVQLQLESNTTTDETTETTGLTAFGSTGFTVGALAQMNTSAATYVAWQWKEGATQGFDIVTYTGNGSARTISHNLGVAPNMIIVKARTTASTDQGWPVYHSANTAAPATDYLLLNSTAATADLDTVWNDTAPTSSVFSVGTNANVNANNDTYVAYCFAPVAGYSAFGSYTGNGSTDGPFVFLGFRPRFVMIKGSSFVSNWFVIDTSRSAYNVSLDALRPNVDGVETSTGTYSIDILSNGFKLRTSAADSNTNAATFIWAAFAENPFKLSLAR